MSQARDVREGDWTMAAVDESGGAAGRQGAAGVHRGDGQLGRSGRRRRGRGPGAHARARSELFELFCRYGARDFRDIGHKAIYVANSWRTLQVHRLAACRAGAALARLCAARITRASNPGQTRLPTPIARGGRTWSCAKKIRDDWQRGKLDDARDRANCSTTLRDGLAATTRASRSSSCSIAGVAPQSIWDALFDGAGELLDAAAGHRRAARGDHAPTRCTSPFRRAADDETRRLLLLQNAAFLPMFREAMRTRQRKPCRSTSSSPPRTKADRREARRGDLRRRQQRPA